MQVMRGFLLLEFIAVLSLCAGLLLISGQWWQHQQRLEQRQHWLQHTEYLLQAAEQFWLQQGRPPVAVSELLSEQQLAGLSLPWQQNWQLHHHDSLLRWQITAPSQAQAAWFAGQFQGATQAAQVVSISQWQPLAQSNYDDYLHRVARPDKPHLNQLASHLDMRDHGLVGIGNLTAQKASIADLSGHQLMVSDARIHTLHAEQLFVARVQTPAGDLQRLVERIDAYAALWQECVHAGGCQ